MNKIFRKCRDFGLMIRLNGLSTEKSLTCVKSLKKANIPLCIINIKNNSDWENQLREIAFKEDLFIAAEGVTNINEVYTAAGNGAQFYILENFDFEFMKELKNSGFFFIPRVSNRVEVELSEKLGLECVITQNSDILLNSRLYNVLDNPLLDKLEEPNIFAIINLDLECYDFELWANNIIKSFLKLDYTEITLKKDSGDNIKDFADMFASTNKCKIETGIENTLTLECSDFVRTVNYFKWKNIFIDPNNTEMKNGNIIKGILDRKLNGFTIILKEKI